MRLKLAAFMPKRGALAQQIGTCDVLRERTHSELTASQSQWFISHRSAAISRQRLVWPTHLRALDAS